MRPKLLFLSLFVASFSFSQQKLSTKQINRLADAGKVYGYIKYFHPFLQYKDINWDSIFVSKVEGIIHANSKEEYADVMQQLLSPLNDNLTRIVNMPKESNAHFQPTTYLIKDSILCININDVNDDSWDKIQEAYGNISKVKGVIFDMRKPANSQFTFYATPGTLVDWTIMYSDRPLFFKEEVLIPSLRSIYYKGASWDKAFKQTSAFKITGKVQKNIPVVFIVGNEDQVPLAAIALQQKGLAVIIQEDGKELVLGQTKSFYIEDSLVIKMRVGEAINADGSLSVVYPNAFCAPSKNPNSAIELARNIMTNGFKNSSNFLQIAPQATSQVVQYSKGDNFPNLANRMLAAAKIFAEIDNFFPCKDLMDKSWEESYRSSILKFIGARDSLDYLRAIAELYSNISDNHGFITYGSFSLKLNPIIQGRGSYIPPVITSVIENKVVVTDIYNDSVCRKNGIKKGDIIISIDGNDPMKQIDEARKYQSASTVASQNFYISKFLLFGNEGQIRKLKVQGSDGKIRDSNLPTLKEFNGDWWSDDYTLSIFSQHTKPSFKLLTKDIGYADLTSRLGPKDVDSMFNLFKNTKAIILDDRGYPHFYGDFRRIQKNKNAILAKYTFSFADRPNIEEIGTSQKNFKETCTVDQNDNKDWNRNNMNGEWVYPGKIVILINEAPQSSGEDIALKWKTSANAILIGSPTSGTNGNMGSFVIPGNITLWLSVNYASNPDGKRTQRVGVQPDIYVRPTIKGIQAGKDEVLERAVKFLQTGK